MIRRKLGQWLSRTGAPVLFAFDSNISIFDGILDDFCHGIGCGLEGISSDELSRIEREVVWHRRSFFREGYAFALAGLTRRRGNPERRNRGIAPFRMMHYTGYGFWNGCVAGALRVREHADVWTGVSDYPRFYPFLVGGRSFGQVVRAKAVTHALIRSFEGEAQPSLTEAAWHGVGRALWFRSASRPDILAEVLGLYPPAAKPMSLGLGFAMTYTQLSSPASVAQSIRSMPLGLRHDLRVGGGVALAALAFEMPEQEDRVRTLFQSGELGPYLEDAVAAEQRSGADGNWYATFNRELARAPIRTETPVAS